MLKNSITNDCKNIYLNPKPFQITFKSNSYLISISHRSPVTLLNPFSPNISLTKKKLNIYLLFQVSVKNGCNNLYFHSSTFDMIYILFFYTTSLFVVVRWIPQPQFLTMSIWQKQWRFYLLLGKSIRNDYNNLYLHNKPFKITMKPNWYLTSIFRLGLVNLSTLTYPNISLTKAVWNLYVVCHWKKLQ